MGVEIFSHCYLQKCMKACLILLVSGSLFAQTTLNMSQDLVTKKIASANLTPDTPTLDARPLFEAATAYASQNNIATLIADPGRYYFLSLHNPNVHALLNGIANLTIDWQHSDLVFAFSNTSAIECLSCNTVTMENFTVDYQQLPFTQAVVTAVDATNHRLTFQTIPGWQSPADFNTNRAPDGSDVIYMFIFRNGVPITQVSRLSATRPVTGNTISIANANDPWASPAALAAIQPGDTIVWTDRSGPPALSINGGQKVIVSNVSVYSSGQIAVYFGRVAGATADHVQVIPRPGSARLISSNADGIHVSFGLANNSFVNNIVRRTCDDALAISSGWIATVSQVVNSTSITVARIGDSPFPVGASLSLINPNDATVSGTANIVSETPAASAQTFTNGEMVTLTLDKAITGSSGGFGVVDADASKRSTGSVIAYNTVEEGVFSRGIWLASVEGANVHDNFIQRTSNDGILIQQLNSGSFMEGLSSGVTIKNNVVDSALSYGGISNGPVVTAASIHSVSESSANGQVTTSPMSSIIVTGNRVTNSPRTAIRLENVSGGTITGNTIQGFGLAPSANLYIIPPCCEPLAQYLGDFSMAVVTNYGLYTSTPNIISDANGLASTVSSASYFPKVAASSFVVAYGQNLTSSTVVATQLPLPTTLGGVNVQVTDSAGVTRGAQIYYIAAPGAVCFLIPDGTAAGVATVTIGSSSGGTLIDTVAPGIYTANASGSGVAAALAALYGADGSVTPQAVFSCPAGAGSCVAAPMSLGSSSDSLIVSFYGTGWRNSSPASTWASIGGTPTKVQYIGAVTGAPGLDQLNLIVAKGLAGAGEVPVVFTTGGQTANVVTINIQ
jgi:uncharacterized protein (TIGR03437 family)